MKLRHAFLAFALVFGCVVAADTKKPVALSVEITRVLSDCLVAELIEFRSSSAGSGAAGNGGGTSTRTRVVNTGRMVVLTPAGKCAVGDRFDVNAREEGTKVVAGTSDDQPLRQYRVLKATRL